MPTTPWRHPAHPAPPLHEVDALIAELEAYLAQDAADRSGDGEELLLRAKAILWSSRPRDSDRLTYRPRGLTPDRGS